jgi:hypothetical protein
MVLSMLQWFGAALAMTSLWVAALQIDGKPADHFAAK